MIEPVCPSTFCEKYAPGTIAPFTVDGAERELRHHPRHSSPWAEECALGLGFDIREGGARLAVNFDTAGRSVEA